MLTRTQAEMACPQRCVRPEHCGMCSPLFGLLSRQKDLVINKARNVPGNYCDFQCACFSSYATSETPLWPQRTHAGCTKPWAGSRVRAGFPRVTTIVARLPHPEEITRGMNDCQGSVLVGGWAAEPGRPVRPRRRLRPRDTGNQARADQVRRAYSDGKRSRGRRRRTGRLLRVEVTISAARMSRRLRFSTTTGTWR